MIKKISVIHDYFNKSILFSLIAFIAIPFLFFYSIEHKNLLLLSASNFYMMHSISEWLVGAPEAPKNKNIKWIYMAILYPLTTAIFYYSMSA